MGSSGSSLSTGGGSYRFTASPFHGVCRGAAVGALGVGQAFRNEAAHERADAVILVSGALLQASAKR
jgi:hypothetical protein